MELHISLELMFFSFLKMLRRGIAGLYGILFSMFRGASNTFSILDVPIYILTNIVHVFPLLHILANICYF